MNEDLQLLRRYDENRDPEAFSALVGKYESFVYAVCLRILHDPAGAEDAAQECFFSLARDSGSVRSSIGGWLHQRATHVSINALRQQRARARRERMYSELKAANGKDPSWDEVAPLIDQALDELPEELRVVLVEHFLCRRTQAELAEELGVSPPTLSRRVEEALDALRKKLRKAGIVIVPTLLLAFLTEKVAVAAPATLSIALGKIAIAGIGKATAGATAAATGAAAGGSTAKIIALIAAGAIAAGAATTYVITKDKNPPPIQGGAQMQAISEVTRAFMLLVCTLLAPDTQQEIPIDFLVAENGIEQEASYVARRTPDGVDILLRKPDGQTELKFTARVTKSTQEDPNIAVLQYDLTDVETGETEKIGVGIAGQIREASIGNASNLHLTIGGRDISVSKNGHNLYITGHRQGEMYVVQLMPPGLPADAQVRVSVLGFHATRPQPWQPAPGRDAVERTERLNGDKLWIDPEPILTASDVANMWKDHDREGHPRIGLLFNERGSGIFETYTGSHVRERLAIVVSGEIMSAPVIMARIAGGHAAIEGRFTEEEADNMLRAIAAANPRITTVNPAQTLRPVGQAGPENGGLRLALAISTTRAAGQDLHDVRLELINVSDKPILLVANWPYEDLKGSYAEFLGSIVQFETFPEVQPPTAQTAGQERVSSQPLREIPPGERLTLQWQARGKMLKPPDSFDVANTAPVFPTDGLYGVRARVVLTTNDGRHILLTSNEVPVVIGGKQTMPKYATARITGADPEKKTVELNLGSMHGLEKGDVFLTRWGLGASWRITITQVEAYRAIGQTEELHREPQEPEFPQEGWVATLEATQPAEGDRASSTTGNVSWAALKLCEAVCNADDKALAEFYPQQVVLKPGSQMIVFAADRAVQDVKEDITVERDAMLRGFRRMCDTMGIERWRQLCREAFTKPAGGTNSAAGYAVLTQLIDEKDWVYDRLAANNQGVWSAVHLHEYQTPQSPLPPQDANVALMGARQGDGVLAIYTGKSEQPLLYLFHKMAGRWQIAAERADY